MFRRYCGHLGLNLDHCGSLGCHIIVSHIIVSHNDIIVASDLDYNTHMIMNLMIIVCNFHLSEIAGGVEHYGVQPIILNLCYDQYYYNNNNNIKFEFGFIGGNRARIG